MRRRSSRRGSGKSRRKVHWIGSHIWSDIGTFTEGEVATAWAKWPAGEIDTDTVNLESEPSEETLVRSIWSPYCSIHDALGLDTTPVWITFGLIAWDAVLGDTLHRVVNGPGSAPDPYFGVEDWILRKSYIFCPGDDLVFMSAFPTTDVDSNSRAMRKCPPSTGILHCVSFHKADDSSMVVSFGNDVRLGVKRA